MAFNNNVYQPFTIDLSDIDASGKGYIFIRHQSEKSAGFLFVDDISYMTYPEGGYIEPTEWKTVNNVSTMHYALKGLEPKTIVDYTREPYRYRPGNVRVTFDYDIRTGLQCTDFLNPDCVTVPAGDAGIIMEVKWDEYLPDIIRDVVWMPGRRETAFSKYAQCRIYG